MDYELHFKFCHGARHFDDGVHNIADIEKSISQDIVTRNLVFGDKETKSLLIIYKNEPITYHVYYVTEKDYFNVGTYYNKDHIDPVCK